MCITEDHLLSREGWSQLETVEMELTGPRMDRLGMTMECVSEALVQEKYKEPVNGQI